MGIKVVIFDFDGVLAESNDIKTKAFSKLYQFAGSPYDHQGVEYHVKHGGVSRFKKIEHFYAEILKQPLSKMRFEELCDQYARLVKELVVQADYVPGAKEFLEQNASQLDCYVVSGAPQVEVREVVKSRGMNEYFQGVYGSPEEKVSLTKRIIMDNGYDPSEVLFVGDALSDFKAAEENGLHFVARVHADNREIFRDKNCVKISDLTELEKFELFR